MNTGSYVWVDLENTPHVLFFEPFLKRLRNDGWQVRVTAKPQSQTLELATARGIKADVVGGGDFVGIVRKVFGGGLRALALSRWLREQGGLPRLLLSSSRSAALAALMNRLPSVVLLDYEHSATLPFRGSVAVWWPDVLSKVTPSALMRKSKFYDGLKENLYLDGWKLDRAAERDRLGLAADRYVVVTRPPATSAHYAVDSSLDQWFSAVHALAAWNNVTVLVSFRSREQQVRLSPSLPQSPALRLLEEVVPGPGLVAAADLVVGGGGTMNREAAVLGVPVWSVFCGPTPEVDRVLAEEGRLKWVRNPRELSTVLSEGRPRLRDGRCPRAGFDAIYSDLASRLRAPQGGISSASSIPTARTA